MDNNVLKEYYARLRKEAILKSFLIALGIAFVVLFVTATACWFAAFSGYWVCIITFAVSLAAAMPLLYFFRFRPTQKSVAKRLDKLGLDERILTMVELEGNDSYIATRQRNDALSALGKLNSKLVKIAVSASMIAFVAIGFVLSFGMTTVYGLSEAGIIDNGGSLLGEITKQPDVYYDVEYLISEEGAGKLYAKSEGIGKETVSLKVKKGDDAEGVLPVAAQGYAFVGWSDMYNAVYRQDKAVSSKITVTALFEKVEFDFEDDEASDGFFGGSGDGSNSSGGAGNGHGGEGSQTPPSQDDIETGTGDDTEFIVDYIIDGNTELKGPVYEEAKQEMIDELGSSEDNGGDAGKIALDYLEAIGRE